MDRSLIQDIISLNQPFKIETASGRIFEIPHHDYIAFSPKGTTLAVFYEENDVERFAWVPLLTITSVLAEEPPATMTS